MIDAGDLSAGGKLQAATFIGSGIMPDSERDETALLPAEKAAQADDLSGMNLKDLVEAHDALHEMWRGQPATATSDLVRDHALIVDEMAARNAQHPRPPWDRLDDASCSHETSTTQPEDSQPPEGE